MREVLDHVDAHGGTEEGRARLESERGDFDLSKVDLVVPAHAVEVRLDDPAELVTRHGLGRLDVARAPRGELDELVARLVVDALRSDAYEAARVLNEDVSDDPTTTLHDPLHVLLAHLGRHEAVGTTGLVGPDELEERAILAPHAELHLVPLDGSELALPELTALVGSAQGIVMGLGAHRDPDAGRELLTKLTPPLLALALRDGLELLRDEAFAQDAERASTRELKQRLLRRHLDTRCALRTREQSFSPHSARNGPATSIVPQGVP